MLQQLQSPTLPSPVISQYPPVLPAALHFATHASRLGQLGSGAVWQYCPSANQK
jgi:hypothetical protein